MTTPEAVDSTFDRELAGLPVRDASPERVAHIRARCLAALTRTQRRQTSRRQATARWRVRLEAVAAAGLAALYLAAAAERVLQILG